METQFHSDNREWNVVKGEQNQKVVMGFFIIYLNKYLELTYLSEEERRVGQFHSHSNGDIARIDYSIFCSSDVSHFAEIKCRDLESFPPTGIFISKSKVVDAIKRYEKTGRETIFIAYLTKQQKTYVFNIILDAPLPYTLEKNDQGVIELCGHCRKVRLTLKGNPFAGEEFKKVR